MSLADTSSQTTSVPFAPGAFVRLVQFRHLWGRIIGPSETPGRWIFEYAQGARVTNKSEAFEAFTPTPRQLQEVKHWSAGGHEGVTRPTVVAWPERAA